MEKGHIDYALYLDSITDFSEEVMNSLSEQMKDFTITVANSIYNPYQLWKHLSENYDVKFGKCYLFVIKNIGMSFYDMDEVVSFLSITKKENRFFKTEVSTYIEDEEDELEEDLECARSTANRSAISFLLPFVVLGFVHGYNISEQMSVWFAQSFIVPFVIAIYMLPTYFAFRKIHPNRWGVFLINILPIFITITIIYQNPFWYNVAFKNFFHNCLICGSWFLALVWTVSYDPYHKR